MVDVAQLKYVVSRLISSLSDGNPKDAEKMRGDLTRVFEQAKIVERQIGENLHRNPDAHRLFAKTLKRLLPERLADVPEYVVFDAIRAAKASGQTGLFSAMRNAYEENVMGAVQDSSRRLVAADSLTTQQVGRQK